jgi:nucleoside 2-deoxyribosyltransferase
MSKKVIYIAGPMRGYHQYNFPAFIEAERILRAAGWEVLNPAQNDLDNGFDVNTPEEDLTKEQMRTFMEWDVKAVLRSDAICVLAGWEDSTGANVETGLARWLQLELYRFVEGDEENPLKKMI